MQQDILINWAPHESRVAVVENGAVQEVHIERSLERGLVGNIYLGKVVRVLPGMQSAFIDIGLERSAFLHVADLMSSVSAKHAEADATPPIVLPIEKQVFEGQSMLVQVMKDPLGSKGARLSAQLSIAGRLLVFLPQDDHIGVSQKIPVEQRHLLRDRLSQLAHQGEAKGGFILRTNGEEATDPELIEDITYLRKTWERIRLASVNQAAKSLLHQDLNLLQRVLRDFVTEGTQTIRIDSGEQFSMLKAFGEEFMPSSVGKLVHYKGERPIFDLFNIDADIQSALGRRVELKSGGYLIIDQTEAMTTVDVNTGGFVGVKSFDETIFKTNLEAAGAIARQLRLRNLGGMMVIDFIDMQRSDHQSAVLGEFAKQLAKDRVKTSFSGFSPLGLVEMTRKRTRESLAHLLCQPCASCQGRGIVNTSRSVAYDILREILREARQFNPQEFRVLASPAVIELLQEEENHHLAGLSDFIRKPISLMAETGMGPEDYNIVLL
ncbi:MAG: ribonuclease G [Burkholderiales bacterium]|nr:ribonuclease G [Burkholderiales bacterium]